MFGCIKVAKNVPTRVKLDPFRISQILLNLIGNSIKFTDHGSIVVEIKWLDSETINEDCFKPPHYLRSNEDVAPFSHRSLIDSSNYDIINVNRRNFLKEAKNRQVDSKRGLLKISVADTGCGMSPQALSKLFQKFSQVSQDLPKRRVGTGLGLYITKTLVKKMGGDIRAYSQVNAGTCFILCIPVECTTTETLSVQNLKEFF